MGVEFFCVSGRDFFPGAVALVNSLRLVGHDEPITVLDCGLEAKQRRLLTREAKVIEAPDDLPPSLQKLVAPLASSADVVAILDADIIVTRNLGELIERARAGALVGFENESERFFEQWADLLGTDQLRRGPYLSSSALLMDSQTAGEILPRVQAHQLRLQQERTWLSGGDRSDPLYFADQDLLNAVALDRLPVERVVAIGTEMAPVPPFSGLRLRDPLSLSCENRDGTHPFMVHHYSRKPWLVRVRANVYSRLMTRVLLGPGLALRLEPADLPARLRRGPSGALARLAVDFGIGIPHGIRRRLTRRPAAVSAWRDSPRADSTTE